MSLSAKPQTYTPKYKQNFFYHRAQEIRRKQIADSDIQLENVTDDFFRELDIMVENGEIIIININTKMRLGKSSCGLAIAQHIWELLIKYNYRRKGEVFGIKNIARDQQEFTDFMRNENLMNTVILTDEFNQLENTGENVTREKALQDVFSSVQAVRLVHRVCCSPKDIVDPNADILLCITSINKESLTTHANLYYRWFEGSIEHIQLIGYVEIYVGNVIKNWELNVRKVFYKVDKSKHDKDYIREQAKRDWYVKYVIDKHNKLELQNKHGILRPRELKLAGYLLDTIRELQGIVQLKNLINRETIQTALKIIARKHKLDEAMFGEDRSINTVMTVLRMMNMYQITKSQMEALERLGYTNKVKQKESELKVIEKLLSTIIDELKEKEKLYNEYKKEIDEVEG